MTQTDRPAVVFVHGWQGDHTVWRDLIAELGDDVRAIAVDLPGSGDAAEADGPYNLKRFARHVREVIESQGLAPAVVVGHSMGAKVAVQLAIDAPGLVSGLVLVAPVAVTTAGFSERGEAYLRATAGDAARVREWLTKTIGQNHEPETLERLCRVAARANPGAMLESLDSWMHTDLSEHAKAINEPALVIAPENDQPDNARVKVADLLPNASFAVLARATHYAIVENPREVAAMIRAWLQQSISSSGSEPFTI
jgi:non-heme chloroperoxidase